MYEITIAIPVYNVESYIKKSMESALSQTFQDIEFLVIDDKGEDRSMEIIRKFQIEHPRGKDIRIIDNGHNMGLSETRNVALKEASGRYLYFLDSDDYICSNCIELFYQIMIKEEVNVVIGSFQEELLDGTVRRRCQLPYIIGHKQGELAALKYSKLDNILFNFTWNVLYDLSFLHNNNIFFKPVRICEDTLFWYDVYPLVESFVLLSDITYFYVIRPNSLSYYNSRVIPYSEVKEQIELRNYGKRKMMEFQNQFFFWDMVNSTMLYSLSGALSLCRNYKNIFPPLKNTDLNELLKFPITIHKLLIAGKSKDKLLIYYMLSHLPGWLKFFLLKGAAKYYYRNKK